MSQLPVSAETRLTAIQSHSLTAARHASFLWKAGFFASTTKVKHVDLLILLELCHTIGHN
jgi:hypothetical protein